MNIRKNILLVSVTNVLVSQRQKRTRQISKQKLILLLQCLCCSKGYRHEREGGRGRERDVGVRRRWSPHVTLGRIGYHHSLFCFILIQCFHTITICFMIYLNIFFFGPFPRFFICITFYLSQEVFVFIIVSLFFGFFTIFAFHLCLQLLFFFTFLIFFDLLSISILNF